MSKRKNSPKSPHKTAIVILLIAIFSLSVISSGTNAATETDKWLKVGIPTDGAGGNWVLAGGSDVQYLTLGADGALYAYGKGLTYTLYKSTNGGYGWSYIGNVKDIIVAIAASPADGNYLCYATTSTVYLSIDGGKNFNALPAAPGGAGTGNIEITSLATAFLNKHIIIVGTKDTDNAQFGGVYTLDMESVIPAWVNTGAGSYDVCAVAASPNFAADRQMVAVVTDETNTYVITRIADAAWGATTGNARLNKDNAGGAIVAVSAAVAFPGDYDSDTSSGSYVQFIGVNTGSGNGDVYKITGTEAPGTSSAADLNIGSAYNAGNIDVTGLAAKGAGNNVTLLAGAAASARTYASSDSGISWKKSRKDPSGGSRTCVLFAQDGSLSYAATTGTESAFSASKDGAGWDQRGMIDTTIGTIIDFAPSPGYSQDGTMFLLTFGGKDSLWRSLDGGAIWERTFSSGLTGVDNLLLAGLSPQYGSAKQVIFLTGISNGNPAVWKSTDNGQSFIVNLSIDPVTKASFTIGTWVIVNDNEFFAACHDGSKCLVYHTLNGGFTYSPGIQAGTLSPVSLALSPDFTKDGTVLTGNSSGWVYLSQDGGNSFKPLPFDATSAPLNGAIYVGFDAAFAQNRMVYAVSNTADKGVYRFKIGTSSAWERIDGTLPAGARLNRTLVSPEGTLYAANARAGGGMERCLNPTYSLGPSFETVTRGLADTATLSGLWHSGSRLWAIDTANNNLLTFAESLTGAIQLTSPPNGAPGVGTINNNSIINVSLDWEAASGATTYQWQIDFDTDFSAVPAGFEGTTQASSVRLPALEPATTYYWHVRTTAPAMSPWSEKWSFTTGLSAAAVTLKAEYPPTGARDVSVSPLFQWSAVTGTDTYELLVAADAAFTSPVITRIGEYALPTTAWQCNFDLKPETTYYWKVRARTASTYGDWSAVSAFKTISPPPPPAETPVPAPMTAPLPTVPPTPLLPFSTPLAFQQPPPQLSPSPLPSLPALPPPPPPAPPPAPELPNWTVYLLGGLLLAIIVLSISMTVIVLAVVRRE